MILDSSAVVAIVLREAGYEALLAKMTEARSIAISAPILLEASIVLSARLGEDARGRLTRLLSEGAVQVYAFTDSHTSIAMDAWLRFGKGRHPAALNFGDCLAYASAIAADEPLLCVGDDFPQTDCPLA